MLHGLDWTALLCRAQQKASHPFHALKCLVHALVQHQVSLLVCACAWLRTSVLVQVIFFVPFLSITTDGPDATTDVYGIGKVMFIGIIGVVSWEIALISRFWTWIFILVWALSYAVTFPFLWALGALFQGLKVYDSSQVRPSALTRSRCQRNRSALAYKGKTFQAENVEARTEPLLYAQQCYS